MSLLKNKEIQLKKKIRGRRKVLVCCVYYAKSTLMQELESLNLDRLVKTQKVSKLCFSFIGLQAQLYLLFQVNGLIFNVVLFFPHGKTIQNGRSIILIYFHFRFLYLQLCLC